MGTVSIVKRSVCVAGIFVGLACVSGCASKAPACYDPKSSDLDAYSNACLNLFSKDASEARKALDGERSGVWTQTRKAEKSGQDYREIAQDNEGVAEAARGSAQSNRRAEQKRLAMALFARVSTKNLRHDAKPSEDAASAADYARATEALEACALGGDRQCQRDLARLLADERNPGKNYAESDGWLRKADREERNW